MEQCISVIVPIYNVEPYLKRAVDSILNQTYQNLEIILVDDGSPDECGKICDDYAKSDNRIKVIHKENGGLSDARNAGLEIASGEYIAFVDSDDYIACDYMETLMHQIVEHDADVSMCSYAVTNSLDFDSTVFEKHVEAVGHDAEHEKDGTIEVCSREQLLSNLYDANHRDATYFIVSWNKLYKASLWKDIRFPKGKIHEDEATTYKIYDIAKKGVYIHKALYGYFSAPGSITRARFNLKRLQWLDALDDRIAYFEEKKLSASESEKSFVDQQIACAKRARADAAIHYYYPLKEELPAEYDAKKRLRQYVKNQWKAEKGLGYFIFMLSPEIYRFLTNIDRDKRERMYQVAFILLFAWLTILCLYKLDVKYVDPWDEARHGVNAYEMQKQNLLFRNTYLYETDYYNLKPPLSMWTIMLSMALFGKNVFAMRFPSVVFYLILAFVVACFVRKRYGRVPALLTLALLAANTTPFIAHMVRSGDADSLYVLLFSLAMICMLQIRNNHRNLYWCGIFFALAFLTKSFHAGVIAVIGGLYLLCTGELKRIKWKEYLKFTASVLIPLGIWGVARLLADGLTFFKEMWATDVAKRSGSGFGSNEAGFFYYFSYYLGKMSGKTQIYLLALIGILIGAAILLYFNRKRMKMLLLSDDVIGFLLWICVPTLAFSAVHTKLLWYLYPVITALLIASAILIGKVISKKEIPAKFRSVVLLAFCIVFVIYTRDIYKTISAYGVDGNQTNDFQILIQDSAKVLIKDDNSLMTYAYRALKSDDSNHPIDGKWAQQDVFLAEAYGDYYCKDGALDALLEQFDENRIPSKYLLFTSQYLLDFYNQTIFAEEEFKNNHQIEVLAERGEYVSVLIK